MPIEYHVQITDEVWDETTGHLKSFQFDLPQELLRTTEESKLATKLLALIGGGASEADVIHAAQLRVSAGRERTVSAAIRHAYARAAQGLPPWEELASPRAERQRYLQQQEALNTLYDHAITQIEEETTMAEFNPVTIMLSDDQANMVREGRGGGMLKSKVLAELPEVINLRPGFTYEYRHRNTEDRVMRYEVIEVGTSDVVIRRLTDGYSVKANELITEPIDLVQSHIRSGQAQEVVDNDLDGVTIIQNIVDATDDD